MTEQRTEWRALVRRPWNILDPQEFRDRGHMEAWTAHGEDWRAIVKSVSHRSEEDHRRIVAWQKRIVTLGEWLDDEWLDDKWLA